VSQNNENVPLNANASSGNLSTFSTLARSLGGSAALGLLAASAFPAAALTASVVAPAVIVGASLAGLAGGFWAKKLDK
jgi:hypothetical protein